MLVVDDILLFPVKGINWIFRQIHEIAEEELAGEAERLRDSLTELYMMLETGQITEEEFEEQERQLLDRLDALSEQDDMIGEGDEEGGEDEEEQDEDEEEQDEEDDEVEVERHTADTPTAPPKG
ncbi:MAG: gas vesicle protein GvpG [Candidatus Methylumidiphilus sp.]